MRPRESQDENLPNILRLIRLIASIESKEPHLVFRNISALLATGCVPETHDIAIYPQSPKLTFDLVQIHGCTSIRPTLLTYPKCNATLHDIKPKFSGPYICLFRSSDGCEEATGARLLKEGGISPDHFWRILQVHWSNDFFICRFVFLFKKNSVTNVES